MRWETQLRSRRSIPALILHEPQTGEEQCSILNINA